MKFCDASFGQSSIGISRTTSIVFSTSSPVDPGDRPGETGHRKRARRPVTEGAARNASGQGDVAPEIRSELVGHMKALRVFALSLTRDAALADDLVQETVTRAWAHLDRFERGTSMRAWLFTILRNTFRSEWRRSGREVSGMEEAVLADPEVSRDGPDAAMHIDIMAALDALPEAQREALLLVAVLKHSHEEAAALCGVRPATMKSRLSRARRQMADRLGLPRPGG